MQPDPTTNTLAGLKQREDGNIMHCFFRLAGPVLGRERRELLGRQDLPARFQARLLPPFRPYFLVVQVAFHLESGVGRGSCCLRCAEALDGAAWTPERIKSRDSIRKIVPTGHFGWRLLQLSPAGRWLLDRYDAVDLEMDTIQYTGEDDFTLYFPQ